MRLSGITTATASLVKELQGTGIKLADTRKTTPGMRVLEKYEEIMNIILPTLRQERRKTYCPFLPICPKTGKVLEIP